MWELDIGLVDDEVEGWVNESVWVWFEGLEKVWM